MARRPPPPRSAAAPAWRSRRGPRQPSFAPPAEIFRHAATHETFVPKDGPRGPTQRLRGPMAKARIQGLSRRPEEDGGTLADALRQRGVEVSIEPLLSIRTLPGVAIDLEGVQALLFTSSNGVRAFAELSQRRELPCFTVGDATAAAARSAGFAQVESAGGDVRDLARLVSEKLQPAGGLLFHAAASAVAGALAAAGGAAGFGLRRAVLYEAKPAERLADETLRRLADGAIDWVLFFSPRTAQTFVKLIEAAPVADRLRLAGGIAPTQALCLSPAVAGALQRLSLRGVRSALRPHRPAQPAP